MCRGRPRWNRRRAPRHSGRRVRGVGDNIQAALRGTGVAVAGAGATAFTATMLQAADWATAQTRPDRQGLRWRPGRQLWQLLRQRPESDPLERRERGEQLPRRAGRQHRSGAAGQLRQHVRRAVRLRKRVAKYGPWTRWLTRRWPRTRPSPATPWPPSRTTQLAAGVTSPAATSSLSGHGPGGAGHIGGGTEASGPGPSVGGHPCRRGTRRYGCSDRWHWARRHWARRHWARRHWGTAALGAAALGAAALGMTAPGIRSGRRRRTAPGGRRSPRREAPEGCRVPGRRSLRRTSAGQGWRHRSARCPAAVPVGSRPGSVPTAAGGSVLSPRGAAEPAGRPGLGAPGFGAGERPAAGNGWSGRHAADRWRRGGRARRTAASTATTSHPQRRAVHRAPRRRRPRGTGHPGAEL